MSAAQSTELHYDPLAELELMGVPVIRLWLRDTWGPGRPKTRLL
ncbi:hypothetical protein ACFQ0T_14235 [Kitasatospora gansuensis]